MAGERDSSLSRLLEVVWVAGETDSCHAPFQGRGTLLGTSHLSLEPCTPSLAISQPFHRLGDLSLGTFLASQPEYQSGPLPVGLETLTPAVG